MNLLQNLRRREMAQWLEELAKYDLEVIHKLGWNHTNANSPIMSEVSRYSDGTRQD